MNEHVSLKCDVCRKCVREGADRWVGSATITFWTEVGPYVVVLCSRCAEEALGDLGAPGIKEKPEPTE